MEKWIFFLRALFPSWRFFVDAGPTLTLEVRVRDGHWQPVIPQITRSFGNLLLNSEGNFRHACNNNLLHLSQDLSKLSDRSDQGLESLCSYQLTHNIARFYLAKGGSTPSGTTYQMRLSLRQNEQDGSTEILLESPVYEF